MIDGHIVVVFCHIINKHAKTSKKIKKIKKVFKNNKFIASRQEYL